MQDLQQQLKVLEVGKAHETAQLQALAEYVNRAGAFASQQSGPLLPRAEQLELARSIEQVRSSEHASKPGTSSITGTTP